MVLLDHDLTNFLSKHFFYVRRMMSVAANRSALRAQLTAIVEAMAKSVLSQLCKVVDEDMVELHLELSRLLVVNSTLADKVNSLESELTNVRKNDKIQLGQHSVGVQTGSATDGDPCGKSSSQTIRKKTTEIPLTLSEFYCLHSHFSRIYLSHHSGNLWERLVHEFMERWGPIQPRQRSRITTVLVQSKKKLYSKRFHKSSNV